MNLKTTAMYFSPTGGTKKTVEAVAVGISSQINVVDFTKTAQRFETIDFSAAECLVVGVPVYGGRIPLVANDYLTGIKGNRTPAVCIVVYGNREYDDALLELKELMENNGFEVLGGAAFIGEHSYTDQVAGGRPDEEDLAEAQLFGARVLNKWKVMQDQKPGKGTLQVKGNHPYKERVPSEPMAPVTSDDCIFCGKCAEVCPMEAIDFEDYFHVDANRCIRCCACIKVCPTHAKTFVHPMVEKITANLIKNCSNVRKKPELFL